jgi:hypothetical protein
MSRMVPGSLHSAPSGTRYTAQVETAETQGESHKFKGFGTATCICGNLCS